VVQAEARNAIVFTPLPNSFQKRPHLLRLKPVAMISYGLYLIRGATLAVEQSILIGRLGWSDTGWGAVGVNSLTLGITFLAAASPGGFLKAV
jgi:hypothetical protein